MRVKGRKNKGVFTISVALETPKQNPRQTNSSQVETGPRLPQNTSAAKAGHLDPKVEAQVFKELRPSDEQIKAAARASSTKQTGQAWSPDRIKARASNMLQWLEHGEVQFPEKLFAGASKSDRERIKKITYDLGKVLFDKLKKVDSTDFNSDGDGTMYYKNPIMVDSTSSFGSSYDRYWNSTLAKALHYLGTRMTVLTARPGTIAGQSLVGTEDPVNNSKNPNVCSPEEISACIGRERSEMDSFNVNIRGLNGGLHSDFGEPPKLTDGCRKFNKLVNFLDQEFNFVDELMKIRYNDGDSARVLEVKAFPQAFDLIPTLTFDQYEQYMLVAKQSREEGWDSARFVNEVNKLGIDFPQEFLNPADKPGLQLLNPNDPDTETKTTEVMRDAHGNIVCFTPHAIDGKNVYRHDIRGKIYDLLLTTIRHPKTKAWLEQEFGIPPEHDVITINGKEITSVNSFAELDSISKFIKDLNAKGKDPNHKDRIVNISDNDQFYLEITGPNTKDEVVKRYQEATDSNTLSIMRGDSRGTDAPAIAQAVISGGIGVIARGLMNKVDVGSAMVDLLKEDPADGSYKNAGHPDCLKTVADDQYQNLRTGEIKSKRDWAEHFIDKYHDQLHQIDNIHLTNSIFAFLFTKFFEEEGLKFDPPDEASSIVKDPSDLRFRTLTTPDIGFKERGIDQYMPNPQVSKVIKSLESMPFLSKFIKIENARPLMTKLLEGISQVLMWSGGLGIVGGLVNDKIPTYAKVVQRVAAGVNNFASGITRGLRAPTRYPAQFLGEVCNFVAGFFPLASFTHKSLWAFGNGLLQLGRAGSTISAENLVLDNYKKGTEEEVKQAFGDKNDSHSSIRECAGNFAETRSNWITKLSPMMGSFLAETVADFVNGLKMTWEFLTVKGYRKGAFETMFRNAGLTKTSMTSGKDYTNVASVSHVYAASGIFAMASSFFSMFTHKLNLAWLDTAMVALGNLIPTFGMMAAARNVEQDQHGHMRLFTDVIGRTGKFDPEKAGVWQRLGVWGMALGSLALNNTVGQLLQMVGLGAYTKGIGHEFNPVLEMGAVNTLRKNGRYAKADADLEKSPETINFVKQYFGREAQRGKQEALAQAA
ncbi:MAG: hypothetical protein OXU45_05120 [Candidatus Melainabacteria bacterium]|nr:hypothetical protein [Candidatus Melainabacteria bacterium]